MLNIILPFLQSKIPTWYSAVILIGQEKNYDPKEMLKTTQFYLYLTNIFIALALAGFVTYLFYRFKKFKAEQKKKSLPSDMSPEEIKAIYGEDSMEGIFNVDRMSRDELRIIAEKELEKEGLKPGDKNFFKGPLDWEDIDEDFKPRPKAIISDFSELDENLKQKFKKKENDKPKPGNQKKPSS